MLQQKRDYFRKLINTEERLFGVTEKLFLCSNNSNNNIGMNKEMNNVIKRIKKWFQDGRIYTVCAVGIFLYTYVPLLALGMYAHSNTDDYWMSDGVHHVFVKTGSFLAAIKYGIENAVWIWKSWDGCFLSMLFTILSPVAFHEDLYCIVYPVISLTMILCSGALAYALLRRVLQWNIWRTVTVWLMFVTLAFQFVPYYGEAYYWWPGAVNYTFFFGIFLLVQAMAVLYLKDNTKKAFAAACFFGFCTGLGNLMTALISPFVLFLEAFTWSVLLKRKERKGIWIIFLFALAGLMINVCAPGNLIRGGDDLFSSSPIQAIFLAIKGATYFIGAYYKKTMTVFLIFTAFVIYEAMGQVKKEFTFRLPLLFFAVSYGVYCALWVPVTYTGVAIYARLGNQLFLGQILLFVVNVVYLSGWIHKKIVKMRWKYLQDFAICVSMVILVAYFHQNSYLYASSQAYRQVISGNAKQFDEQMDERFAMYYDDSVKVVYVKPLEYVPGLFFIQDTSFDSLKDYFSKEFIGYADETDS